MMQEDFHREIMQEELCKDPPEWTCFLLLGMLSLMLHLAGALAKHEQCEDALVGFYSGWLFHAGS